MVTAKRVFYGAALALAGVLLAATTAYLLVSDNTLVAWIAQRTESATGVAISYREPVKLTRTLSPTLTLGELAVDDPEAGVGLHTSSLQMRISLPRLILGRLDIPRLWLGDTRIELTAGQSPDASAVAPSADQPPDLALLPALHDVRIAQLQIVTEQREVRLPVTKIRELALAIAPETAALELRAQLDVAAVPVAIEAKAPNFLAALKAGKVKFTASARSAVADLAANGAVDIGKSPYILDGNLSVQASDLQKLPTGMPGLQVPGTLAAEAHLGGTLERLAVSDIAVQWQGPAQSALDIKGRIDDLDDLAGVALDVSGRLGESPWLAEMLPDTLGILKQAKLSGRISGDAPRLAVGELNLAARDTHDLDLSLKGRFDLAVTQGSAEAENIDIDLAFSAPTTRAARALLFDGIPEFGAIQGRADIVSTTEAPAFENIEVRASDPAGIDVALAGRIAKFPLRPDRPNRGYDLDASIKAAKTGLIAERLGLEASLAGPAHASFRIEGDSQALRLEQIKLTAGAAKALQVSALGQLHFREWDQADPFKAIDLTLRANSRDTRSLGKLLGRALPELGALTASARLRTVSNRHQINDFEVQTAKGAPIGVSINGAADHVAFLPGPSIEGIELKAGVTAADAHRLNALFGLGDAIPPIGPAKASAKLSGNDRQISVTDVAVVAGKADILLIEASGVLGTLAASNNWRPETADLAITAGAKGSKALLEAMGYAMPELGPLKASARIRTKDKRLGLESGRLLIGDAARPVIQVRGFADDLLEAGTLRWDVELGLDADQFAAFAGKQQLIGLAPLRGTMRISNNDGTLGIDALSIQSTGSELLSLHVAGQYGDFGKPASLSLTGRLRARDMQILGAFVDRDWPALGPVRIDTDIKKADKNIVLDTRMRMDKFELDADILGIPDVKPLRLSGKITARNAFLPQMAKQAAETIKQKQSSKEHFFSRDPIGFDWLKKVDLDLSIDIESFDPELARGDSGQARLRIESGRLSLSPVTIKYPKGQLELDVQVEAGDKPRVSFKAVGKNLDPWRSLYVDQAKKELDAELNVEVDLQTSGNSVHELAANAQGNIALYLKDGVIRQDLIDLVFVDIIGWTWSKTAGKKYLELSCGVADYTIEQGVIATRAFLLDSKQIAITGEGRIDLGRERLDYVFLPRQKSRLIGKSDPVKVTGPLNDPSVDVIPWKSAARAYGTLVFAPYIIAGTTATGFLKDLVQPDSKESPCAQYEERRKARVVGVTP